MLVKKIFVSLLLISFSSTVFAEKFSDADILGFWLTESGKGVIEVYKNGEEFEGKLVWIQDIHEGLVKDKLDKHNPDEKLQKRSILNLRNLSGFKFKSNEWSGGKIYDPKSGKTYSSYMKLENINQLNLRGYVGIPLFGRTSEWKRQKGSIPDRYKSVTK